MITLTDPPVEVFASIKTTIWEPYPMTAENTKMLKVELEMTPEQVAYLKSLKVAARLGSMNEAMFAIIKSGCASIVKEIAQ